MKNNKGHSTIEAVITTVICVAVSILVAIIFCGMIIWSADKAMQRTEEYDCNKWSQEADQYENYYQTDWQVEQCNRYNITINAPIK